MTPKLFTVGYEGRALDELITELVDAGVERLIDVRELPLSRRRGFSKTPLSEALQAVGIRNELDLMHGTTVSGRAAGGERQKGGGKRELG